MVNSNPALILTSHTNPRAPRTALLKRGTMIRRLSTLVFALSILTLVGCGSTAPQAFSQAPAVTAQSLLAEELAALGGHRGVPTNFKVVKGIVVTILPDDVHGIPHQEFRIRLTDPTPGKVLEVNHNTRMAKPVANLKIGDKLTIRGVTYSGAQPGIHWTHHAKKPGDAGYIRTEAGVIYE